MLGILNLNKKELIFNDKKLKVIIEDNNNNYNLTLNKDDKPVGRGWYRYSTYKNRRYVKLVLNTYPEQLFLIAFESNKNKGIFYIEKDTKEKE